ncbi:hypothetical protein DAPPUDRAFT_338313 [Daphnia pulex]|uniref:Uncharacterized protein n=1 Tax=Daphnia pulex TaxID=6669 RepID=E9I2P6_DAPPU|nr:hypothetical protein DAPPUDRAFT_338313 [Daphnia pulex]|eukprot:EFX61734.1 hypothetical protein DAPPUDRAFT_338313 [Daphnia pulex]
MRQQLNDLTVDDQAVPTRASSVVSGLSGSTAGHDESAHVNGFKRRYSANVVLPGSYTDRSANYDIGKRSNSYVGSSSSAYIDCTIVRPTDFHISCRSGLYTIGSSVHAGDYSHHARPDDQ